MLEKTISQYMAEDPRCDRCSRCGDKVKVGHDTRACLCWYCTQWLADQEGTEDGGGTPA